MDGRKSSYLTSHSNFWIRLLSHFGHPIVEILRSLSGHVFGIHFDNCFDTQADTCGYFTWDRFEEGISCLANFLASGHVTRLPFFWEHGTFRIYFLITCFCGHDINWVGIAFRRFYMSTKIFKFNFDTWFQSLISRRLKSIAWICPLSIIRCVALSNRVNVMLIPPLYVEFCVCTEMRMSTENEDLPHFLVSFFFELFNNFIRIFFLAFAPSSDMFFDLDAGTTSSSSSSFSGFCKETRLLVSGCRPRFNEGNSLATRVAPLKAASRLSYPILSRFNFEFSFSNLAISFSSCAMRLSFSLIFLIFL